MKIFFNKTFKDNLRNVLRRCGYIEIYDRQSRQISYVRRLGNYFYPRFHLYPEQTGDKLIMNLHLDQKKISYKGQKAHSGEYGDEIVQREAESIKNLIT